jgi:hypothetical protein
MARRTITTATIVLAGVALVAVSVRAADPHMQSALDHLIKAETALQRAKANKEGHRAHALEQIRKAEDELRQGMGGMRGSLPGRDQGMRDQHMRDQGMHDKGMHDQHMHDQHMRDQGMRSDHQGKASFGDLVGAKASGLDPTMQKRGFANKGGHKRGDVSYTTWYNHKTRQCMEAATRNGRVDSVSPVPEARCR